MNYYECGRGSVEPRRRQSFWTASGCCLMLLVLALSGCTSVGPDHLSLEGNEIPLPADGAVPQAFDENGRPVITESTPPTELAKVSLPEYVLEPPDVLFIVLPRLVPKSPYYIQSGDYLFVTVVSLNANEPPMGGQLQVSFEGTITVGPGYQPIKVAGLTADQAADAVSRAVQYRSPGAVSSLAIFQVSGLQPVAGEHIIQPDGYVSLGVYGRVYVAGMTLSEARKAIEKQLSNYLDNPQASVDVFSFNSKVYYVIQQNPLLGDNVASFGIRGNETVMDALSIVGGLSQVSTKKIWIARPSPSSSGCYQILPVDFDAITREASTATNYQLMPGDRVFIAQDRFVALDAVIQKLINPFERIVGFSFLGAQATQLMQRFPGGVGL
ncbi:MAG: polysaccharide biosynthesis/export family protein [Pirellulales bacterium]